MENLIVIQTCEEFDRLQAYLDSLETDIIAFDTETTGLGPDAEVIGYSIAGETDIGIYVVLSYWDKEQQKLIYTGLKEKSKPIIEWLKTKRLVMHNCNFDCKMVKRDFGIELIDSVFVDTLELAFLLNENRSVGLKDLAASLFGESAKQEQEEMAASVIANGGKWMAKQKEMFKADVNILARYGAKDTILTLKLLHEFTQELFDQNLDTFFFDEESMPLMRGPTYELNTTGLKIDMDKLKKLEASLELECATLKAEIDEAVAKYVVDLKDKKGKKKKFSIGSSQQLAWLLFIKLENEFKQLTKGGRKFAKDTIGKLPYSALDKRKFIRACQDSGKDPAKLIACDKATLTQLARRYDWVAKLLKYKGAGKILKTYATGMQRFINYGVIYPSFLQHGTTSGRYSSRAPNFQNLPRDDKRIKDCIISRPGKVFVAADYSQLEPRVFASVSQDKRLMECFAKGEDFYSVVGIPIFKRFECSAIKNEDDPNCFAMKYEHERQVSKQVSLASAYGTTAHKQAQVLTENDGSPMSVEQCQGIIEAYFEEYPSVKKMMVDSHNTVMSTGMVHTLYGRPRRIPQATLLRRMFGKNVKHEDLPYEYRTLLNLSMNHRVQGSGASIVNRAAIAFHRRAREQNLDAKIILQVHDEIVAECPEAQAKQVAALLRDCMENTTILPGVKLIAKPKIGKTLAECK